MPSTFNSPGSLSSDGVVAGLAGASASACLADVSSAATGCVSTTFSSDFAASVFAVVEVLVSAGFSALAGASASSSLTAFSALAVLAAAVFLVALAGAASSSSAAVFFLAVVFLAALGASSPAASSSADLAAVFFVVFLAEAADVVISDSSVAASEADFLDLDVDFAADVLAALAASSAGAASSSAVLAAALALVVFLAGPSNDTFLMRSSSSSSSTCAGVSTFTSSTVTDAFFLPRPKSMLSASCRTALSPWYSLAKRAYCSAVSLELGLESIS